MQQIYVHTSMCVHKQLVIIYAYIPIWLKSTIPYSSAMVSLSSLLSSQKDFTGDPYQDTLYDFVFNELLDSIAGPKASKASDWSWNIKELIFCSQDILFQE